MSKCAICGKEFYDNISPLVFLEHINNEHRFIIEETMKEIKDNKWKNVINDKKYLDESIKIVKEIQDNKGNINIKRLK